MASLQGMPWPNLADVYIANHGVGDPRCRHLAATHAKRTSAYRSRSPHRCDKQSGTTGKHDTANGTAERRMQEDGSSAGGGAHPADDQLPPLDARILKEVRRLGRLPKLFNDPRSQEEKAEHSTDACFKEQWKSNARG